jgi:type II secretion system protein G
MQASLERLRQRREERGDEGGFTLIELLIVIVILGILAAIVVFAVQNLTGQSATAACQSQYKTVETAMEAYKAQVGSYPTTGDPAALTTTLEGTALGLDGSTDGPWLKDAPPVSGSTGPYYISWDGTNVGVGTVATHGAKATDAAAAGDANCTDA